MIVRVMVASTACNALYWPYSFATNTFYKDVIIQGINMGGDIRWSLVGCFATGLMMYATRQYLESTVKSCLLSEDGNKIIFEFHGYLRSTGKLEEVNIGNAKIIGKTSRYLRIQVDNRSSKLLIEDDGIFTDKSKLIALLTPEEVKPDSKENSKYFFLFSINY